MFPAVFDSTTDTATYLKTDGTMTSVNLATVLKSTPDFLKLRLAPVSFPLFTRVLPSVDGTPADFFGFAASGTDLYVATTYNLQADGDLPVYQIPKKINKSLVMNDKMKNQFFCIARCTGRSRALRIMIEFRIRRLK